MSLAGDQDTEADGADVAPVARPLTRAAATAT